MRRRWTGGPVSIVVFFFLLAFWIGTSAAAAELAGPEPDDGYYLEETLHHFPHLDASRSLVELLPLVSALDGTDEAAARFLVGNALAELGLHEPAIRELRKALSAPELEAPVAIALCRILSDLGADREVLGLAVAVHLHRFPKEDIAEIAYRAARAAYRQERFIDTREWLRRIPEGTAFEPFGAYLRAQTEFAIGKYGRAIAAAKPILRLRARSATLRVLQDRAAIFLGDLYTELGRYESAVQSLGQPGPESPFAARARRDLLVAQGLRQLTAGEFRSAEPVVERLHGYLEALGRELADSVATAEGVEARMRELRGVWPPKFAVYGRRDWAVGRVEEALEVRDHHRPGGLVRVLAYGPAIWRFQDGRWRPDPWLPDRERTSRFFFPPTGEVARLLQGLALLEEPAALYGSPCTIQAANAIRRRIALWLLRDAEPPTLGELSGLASTCNPPPARDDLLASGHERLREALVDHAERAQDGIRRDRLEIEMAIGRAYLKHVERLEAARREALADPHHKIAQR